MYPEHVINGMEERDDGLQRQEVDMKMEMVRHVVDQNFANPPLPVISEHFNIDDHFSRDNGPTAGIRVVGGRRRTSQVSTGTSSSLEDELLLSTTPFCIVANKKKRSPATPPVGEWRAVPASDHSQNTVNAIRRIVDVMQKKPNPAKSLIKLHLGDPTLTGTLPPCETVLDALQDALRSGQYNGYGPGVGLLEAREALAEYVSTLEAPVTADDLIITSGCSHALQLAIEALANPGDNILVPRPGFPLYATLMRPHGVENRSYDLDMEDSGEVNLDHLESLIDSGTRAIIVNNPSNPLGVVYSKEHLEDILTVADRYKIPIIADEIYGDMTYDGAVFHPMATLQPQVPIISCDGISKRYLVPGWRLGWLTIHDRHGALRNVRDGLRNLAQKIVGPCALVQGALPAILTRTPAAFFEHTRTLLSTNAGIAYEMMSSTPGLKPIRPQGAMYMMVGLDTAQFPSFLGDEMGFIKGLISEESVYCLPGSAFGCPGWIRLLLIYPFDVTRDACNRIRAFCLRHYRPQRSGRPAYLSESLGLEDDESCSDVSSEPASLDEIDINDS